jgi:hypothetical protein
MHNDGSFSASAIGDIRFESVVDSRGGKIQSDRIICGTK